MNAPEKDLRNRILFLRDVIFNQAQFYQDEAVKIHQKADISLLEEKGQLLLQAYMVQGMTKGLVECLGYVDAALNTPADAEVEKPKLVLINHNDNPKIN